jgi:hypothetical protein
LKPSALTLRLELRSAAHLFPADSPLLRDELHPDIAQTLLEWAALQKNGSPLAVEFVVPPADPASETTEEQLAQVVHDHFARAAAHHTQRIADTFRYARAATLVGLMVVIVLLGTAQAIPESTSQVVAGFRESLTIFAWVSMWKPAELWLYEHWPPRYWRRAACRLTDALVKVIPRSSNEGDPNF